MGIDVQAVSINPFWYTAERELARDLIKVPAGAVISRSADRRRTPPPQRPPSARQQPSSSSSGRSPSATENSPPVREVDKRSKVPTNVPVIVATRSAWSPAPPLYTKSAAR